MKSAVIETGGKQYYVSVGDEIYVEKLNANKGETVEFKVLLANGVAGKPYLNNVKAVAEVLKHGKQKKIVIFKYRPKKDSHKKQGHRQPYTKVKITSIENI